MRPFILLFVAVVYLGGLSEAAPFDPSGFQFRKMVNGEPDSEGLARFELDTEVFLESAEKFFDLRLVKVDGEHEVELPYLVSRVDRYVPPDSAKPIRTEIVSFSENTDGSVVFEVRFLEKDKRCATVDFRTPLRDFEKSVTVDASTDGKVWKTLLNNVLIFDRERFLDFRKTKLVLPDNDARFFRVRIESATGEQRSIVREISRTVGEQSGTSVTETGSVTTRAFRINELKFLTAEVGARETEDERTYPVVVEKISENDDQRFTEVYLDTFRAPLTRFSVMTSDRNFRRDVYIQVPDGNSPEKWRTIKRGRIYRYDIGDFHEEDRLIEFGQQRSGRFRILIENGDSPALAIDDIEGAGDVYEALFLADSKSEWALYYGSDETNLAAPQYDTAALVLAKGRGVAAERFILGEAQQNPDFQSGLLHPGWTEQKWILWLVIALVVAGLVAVLARAGKSIEAIE